MSRMLLNMSCARVLSALVENLSGEMLPINASQDLLRKNKYIKTVNGVPIDVDFGKYNGQYIDYIAYHEHVTKRNAAIEANKISGEKSLYIWELLDKIKSENANSHTLKPLHTSNNNHDTLALTESDLKATPGIVDRLSKQKSARYPSL